jgi:peroxiredoxin
LLSDYGGTAASAYGAWNAEARRCRRALFLIDTQGRLRYRNLEVNPQEMDQEIDRLLGALDALR